MLRLAKELNKKLRMSSGDFWRTQPTKKIDDKVPMLNVSPETFKVVYDFGMELGEEEPKDYSTKNG